MSSHSYPTIGYQGLSQKSAIYIGMDKHLGRLGLQATSTNLYIYMYDHGQLVQIGWTRIRRLEQVPNSGEIAIKFHPDAMPVAMSEHKPANEQHRICVRSEDIHLLLDELRAMRVIKPCDTVKSLMNASLYYKPQPAEWFVANGLLNWNVQPFDITEQSFLAVI